VIAALILGSYAVVVALAAPGLLERRWPGDRAPRLTVAVLQVLTCSFLIAATTSGLALAITLLDRLSHLNPSIDACADQLPINDESTVGPILGDLGLAVGGGLAVRIGYCLVATFVLARIRQRSHAAMLRLCARADDPLGVMILDHGDPACYCLPGRPGTIVITSGALERLTSDQLAAVLSHERAHLRGRHHLVVSFSQAVRRTVPAVRLLSYAERETRRLVELIADDTAARHSGAVTVAAALAVIGGGQVPGAALGIISSEGSPALARVARLIGPERKLSRRGRILSILGAVLVVAVPTTLGAVSAVTVLRYCPPSHDNETPVSVIVPWPMTPDARQFTR
jgi:Zn-dependent protease with chaperone function